MIQFGLKYTFECCLEVGNSQIVIKFLGGILMNILKVPPELFCIL